MSELLTWAGFERDQKPRGDGMSHVSPAMTGHVALCTGVNTRYQARARRAGCRTWVLIGQPSRSQRVAMRRMVDAFEFHGDYKRAGVVMFADYYDPVEICELVRK